jgi:NAD(P)H-flavin reductase
VFFGAKDRDDLYDLGVLQRLASRHPWLQVVPCCSADDSFDGEKGTAAEVVARYGPWDQHDFFVSGSPQMVRSTMRALNQLHVPEIRIKHDVFSEY